MLLPISTTRLYGIARMDSLTLTNELPPAPNGRWNPRSISILAGRLSALATTETKKTLDISWFPSPRQRRDKRRHESKRIPFNDPIHQTLSPLE